jgi:hypothetical protein
MPLIEMLRDLEALPASDLPVARLVGRRPARRQSDCSALTHCTGPDHHLAADRSMALRRRRPAPPSMRTAAGLRSDTPPHGPYRTLNRASSPNVTRPLRTSPYPHFVTRRVRLFFQFNLGHNRAVRPPDEAFPRPRIWRVYCFVCSCGHILGSLARGKRGTPLVQIEPVSAVQYACPEAASKRWPAMHKLGDPWTL